MRLTFRRVPLLLALALILPPAGAHASCGAEDCPLDMHGTHGAAKRFSFDLSYQFINQDQVRIGSRRAAVGQLPSPEDEVKTESRTITALGQVRVSDRFGFSASLPFIDRLHRHIANEEGSPPQLREWQYSGLGDLTVLGQLNALNTGGAHATTLALQSGVKLPTGRRHVTPVDGEEPEPSARPGTGSVDVLAGFHVMHPFSAPTPAGERAEVPLFFSVLGRVNGHGTDDYSIGNELQANTGGSYAIARSVQLLAQVNARWRAKDDVGRTDALRDNTGGTWVYGTPGLRLQVSPALSVYGYVQFPLYERVNRIQIVAPYHMLIGTSFSLAP